MTKEKVLLIGNGPSIFNSERGAEIDNFDGKIARFNHYKIDGYEKYIGTRTDILVLGQLNVGEQLRKQYDYILLYQTRLDGGQGIRKIKRLSAHNKVTFFPIDKKDVIRKLLELDPHTEPTTGIIAAYWFVKKNIDLYIYGFDFSNDEYFHDKTTEINDNSNHNPIKESEYMEYLIDQKKVKRL